MHTVKDMGGKVVNCNTTLPYISDCVYVCVCMRRYVFDYTVCGHLAMFISDRNWIIRVDLG